MTDCGPWMQTDSGQRVDLLRPDPASIRFDDIAHHLARINRYVGATREAYCVAQHLCLTMDILRQWRHDKATQFAGFVHDWHEAFTGDITSPMKRAITVLAGGKDVMGWIEEKIDEAIRQAFGERFAALLDAADWDAVKRADLACLHIEKRALMRVQRDDWNLPTLQAFRRLPLRPWSAQSAERAFTARWQSLCAANDLDVAERAA